MSRWIKAGKVPVRAPGPRPGAIDAPADVSASAAPQRAETGAQWAARMEAAYVFTPAELPLLHLAAMALDAAHDAALDMTVRLQAMAKFAAIHKQIHFPPEETDADTTARTYPRGA